MWRVRRVRSSQSFPLGRLFPGLAAAALCGLCFARPGEAAEAPLVGVVRHEVAPGERRLVSLPFDPFGPALEESLWVRPAPGAVGGVRLLVWNAAQQQYREATWVAGAADGCWQASGAGADEGMPVLAPGDGLWLLNETAAPCRVYMAGRVGSGQFRGLVFTLHILVDGAGRG